MVKCTLMADQSIALILRLSKASKQNISQLKTMKVTLIASTGTLSSSNAKNQMVANANRNPRSMNSSISYI